MSTLLYALVFLLTLTTAKIHTRTQQYSTKAQSFESPNLKTIDPFVAYRVTDNVGGVLPQFMHETGMHTASYTPTDYEPKVRAGLPQPYPDTIRVHFTAYGVDYDLELSIMHHLYEPHSKYVVKNGNDEIIHTAPHTLRSYWSHLSVDSPSENWATVTLHDDGRFNAVVHVDGDTLQIDPVEVHIKEMEKHVYSALKQSATKGMTIFRHSDLTGMEKTHVCGAAAASSSLNASQIHYHPQTDANHIRKLLTVDRWSNCYPGDNAGHRVSVGVMADTGYYNAWGSESGVNSAIAAIYSASNAVYLQQLNVFLTIQETVIYSSTGGSSPAFNRAPPTGGRCSETTIDATLTDFSNWRYANRRTQNSIWHLMTNCFPPAGTVGLAWIGTLCSSRYGSAVSSHNRVMWLTVAHETGHNFGASHTFQLGQGKTGGIMDYGDGRLPPTTGDYQFNTEYSKTEMCKMMTTATSTAGFTPYCWGTYGATCGNNIVEPGEDCDDNSGCCDQTTCRLKSTSQCTGNTECCQSCKYTASSASCKSGAGYCSNGKCVDSSCTAFSNLKFCGMVPANSCRQRCSDTSNTCSDSYTTPNLDLPDGTVCNLSPYTTCVSGRCGTAPPVVTFTYSIGSWSDCNCNGVQTRSVICRGSDGSFTADFSKCAGTTPSATQQCSAPTSCQTYSWNQNVPWGSCSVDCGSGVQTRQLSCIGSMSTNPVANSFCTASPPPTSQTCNTKACTTAWSYGAWSLCSSACGGGTITRTATCRMTQNGISFDTDASRCTGLVKDITSQSCNTQACATYSIQYGNWGSCSVSCGSGTQTRAWSCVSSAGGAVDNAKCSGAPQTQQACNTQACAVYDWKVNGWTACTAACGGGTQSRVVSCVDTSTGNLAVENNCKITKPVTIQSCNTDLCNVYAWATSRWGPCSKTCGSGQYTRAVACINSRSYTVVADTYCSNFVKPDTSGVCNAQSCSTYTWSVGDWTSCSATCGGGLQTRSLKCTAAGSLTPVSMASCDLYHIPATAQYCNTGPCRFEVTNSNVWETSEWSNCTQICGTGYRNRLVRCINNDTKEEMPESTCLEGVPMPDKTGECGVSDCPVFWWTGEFTACSEQCGGSGSQTRVVECRLASDPLGAPVGDERCLAQKPSSTGPCNMYACPTWEVSQWSNCSARCNDGIQSRTIECVTHEGLVTSDEMCATVPTPSLTQPCNVMPCPHWHFGVWGPCTRQCASEVHGFGTQTRELVCRMPHDGEWNGRKADDDSLCPPDIGVDGDGAPDAPGGGRPATSRVCATNPCADYYWSLGERSACSKSCGGGVQTAPLACLRAADDMEVNANLCLSQQPQNTFECNTLPCPNYEWFAMSDWSDCNVFCGAGAKTRDVRCRDINPNPIVGIPYELVADEHCANQAKPESSSPCTQSEERCKNIDASGRVNGRCVAGACECRSGYTGQNCTVIPTISGVVTNSAGYGAGIPLNERLDISWKSGGSIDFVNVLLIRDTKSWPFGQYVAQDIVNTGTFIWQVGDKVKDIEGGDGYKIRVWFNDKVYADSDHFTIADPCAYTSCGKYGICVSGACQCVPGYTGLTCAIGPCERANCANSNSQCDNGKFVTDASTETTLGMCNCTNGFSGSQCKTRNGCEAKCKNGGDYTGTVIRSVEIDPSATSDDCGTCACINRWSGPTCETCPIVCANGGVVDKDCTKCTCAANSGYFGPTCECRYYELTMRLDMKNDMAWLDDSVAVNRFKRTLATDVAIAAGDAARTAVDVEVADVTVDKTANNAHTLLVTLHVSLPCIVSSRAVSGYDGFENAITTNQWGYASSSVSQALNLRDVRKWSPLMSYPLLEDKSVGMHVNSAKSHFRTLGIRTREQIISVNTVSSANNDNVSLLGVYNLIAAMFSNTDSPVYHGVVTSFLDRGYIVKVHDPTGIDTPSSPAQPSDPYGTIYSNNNGIPIVAAESSSPRLSTGAIIGIAVGGGVAVLIALAFVMTRYNKYKRQAAKSAAHEIALESTDSFRGTAPSSSQLKEPPTPVTPMTPYEGERIQQYAPQSESSQLR